MFADRIAAAHAQLSADQIGSLYAVGAFINLRNAGVTVILRCASILDIAHAAMDLNANRGDFFAHVGSIGLCKRRQQIDHFLGAFDAQRCAVHLSGSIIRQRPYRLRPGLHPQQHPPHIGVLDNRHRIARGTANAR